VRLGSARLVSAGLIKFDEFALDCDRYELLRSGDSVKLEKLPMELLILLVQKQSNLVTRPEIITRLWGDDTFVDTEHGINTAVRKIRTVLRDDPEQPRFVQTVTGKGYRFIAPITNGNGAAQEVPMPVPAPLPEKPLPEREGTGHPSLPVRKSHSRASLIVAALVASAILMFLFLRPSPPPPRVTHTVQLTSDGRWKFGSLATNGAYVYFEEVVNDHWKLAAVPVSGGEPIPIHTPFQENNLLGISPDKSRLLIGEGMPISENALWELPVLGGTPRRIGNVVAHDASWSPDEKRLAYVNGGDVFLAKADGTDVIKVASNSDPGMWAWSPIWSSDGNRLRFEWYQMRQHIARLWETDANGRNLHPVLPNWSVCCGKWTHDGKYYVFGAWNGLESGMPFPSPNLWAMRMGSSLFHQTSPELFQLTTGPTHFFNQILSTDEKAIFTTSTRKQGELLRYEKKTGRLLPYLRGLSAESVSFSRDGKWIAYVKFPQGELWRSRTDGSEELQLTSPPLLTHAPNWSPDGKQIAFSGQRAGEEWQLYLISADGGVPQPIAQTDTALESTWSPNGRSLLFQIFENGKGRLRKVDLNQRQVSDFPGSEGLLAPRWTQNGRYVAAAKETNGRLMLFDFKIGVWAQWAQVEVDHVPVWSRDGTTLYFVGLLNKIRGIYRVQPNQRTPQLLTDLSDFQFAGSMGTGMSLLPDDEPLLLHDVGGGTEVYALYWDSP